MHGYWKIAVVALIAAISPALWADYTYQQTTQITGGAILSMMKMVGAFSSQARKAADPIASTIYLKGNRLANISADTGEIIDLDKETITQIDFRKHTYTVTTFEQMRLAMENARQQMEKQQPAEQTAAPAQKPDDVKLSFDVKVRKTGAEKEVSGLNSSEAILTMMMNATDQKTQQTGSMAITNDMWMVPQVPGYEQVREFYKRMALKMGNMMTGVGFDLTKMLARNPGATEALAGMAKEMQKLEGVPVMQVMRMGTTMNGQPLPAASEAPLPADNTPAMPSGSDIAKQTAASAIASRLGGFGGFGHKKQASAPPPSDQDTKNQPTSAILMETQITTTSFSSAPVDPAHFEVPAGFKMEASTANAK